MDQPDIVQRCSLAPAVALILQYRQCLVETLQRLLPLTQFVIDQADIVQGHRFVPAVALLLLYRQCLVEALQRLLLPPQIVIDLADQAEKETLFVPVLQRAPQVRRLAQQPQLLLLLSR